MAKKKDTKKKTTKKTKKKVAKKAQASVIDPILMLYPTEADVRDIIEHCIWKRTHANTTKADNNHESGNTSSTPQYAFKTKYRCPRCGATDTLATSTQGNRQYRECQRAVCRRKFSVPGEPI